MTKKGKTSLDVLKEAVELSERLKKGHGPDALFLGRIAVSAYLGRTLYTEDIDMAVPSKADLDELK